MTVQAWETRWRTSRHRRLLTALLALAVLVPLGVLFFDDQRHLGERRSTAAQERHGIEYLLALGQLTIALTDAQAAAVSGEPIPGEVLDRSVAGVADVDDRVGEALQVSERWSQLRTTIERATVTSHADGGAAYAAYEEATGLLLGLHHRLRDTTGLVRDPDPDAYHLQDAAGATLPETIVALGRLGDLVTIAAGGSAGGPVDPPDIAAAVTAATSSADAFVAGIQAALDTTEVRSLDSTVLGKYDRFLRAKDGVLGAVPPDGNVEDVDLGFLAGIRTEQQAAADDLSTALLTELDAMVGARAGDLTRARWTAVVAVTVGLLLVIGLVAFSFVRDPHPPARRSHHSELPGGSGDDGRDGGGTPERSLARMSISDAAGGLERRSGAHAAGDRLSGEVLGSGRADVR